MPVLTASQLKLLYGELEIFANIDLQIDDGARIGIVGPNGGGKTSLIRILVGELQPNGGTLSWASGIKVGYVPQKPSQASAGTLRDEVMSAFDHLRRIEDALASSALDIQTTEGQERRQADRRYASLLQEYEALGGYDYQHEMERVVDGVGLSREALDTPVGAASGGERTRAALAKALLSDPAFLILDEPTNYLDFKGLAWLEDFLGQFPRSRGFMVVSHDRYFLDRVVNQVWELDRGRLQVFPGNYTKYRTLKAEQLKRQQREYERQQEFINREEAFIQRYKAGQRSREARGRATRLERLERIERPEEENTPIRLNSVDASRTGLVVLSTHDLVVGYEEDGQRVQLLSVPNVGLQRGSRTAVIGSNGIGKTTLLRTMLGEIPPLAGAVRLGHNVEPGYFTQGSIDLPNKSTVLDAFLDARNLQLADSRNYLARFLFRGDDVFKPVEALSGGERSRLALARLLITAPNVLVLDEPTTHLDIPSREALEQALLGYEGALIFVSHDRRLISLLANQLWIAEDGAIHPFPYGFEEWVQTSQAEANRRTARESETATRPRRPATKKDAKSQTPKPKTPDYEQIIAELEAKLSQLERQLEKASVKQDINEVARLGQEYNETQSQLEQAWREWGA
jgi:ATP-binding cassette subfamily F protein 3